MQQKAMQDTTTAELDETDRLRKQAGGKRSTSPRRD